MAAKKKANPPARKAKPRVVKDETMHTLVGGPYLPSRTGLPLAQAMSVRDGLLDPSGIEIVPVSDV